MKIVQAVGWYFPGTTGGTEVYVAGLASRLQRLGHVVDIVTPDSAIDAVHSYTYEGAAVHRFPIVTPLTRGEAQGRVPVRGSEWFREWVTATRPDVVHRVQPAPSAGAHRQRRPLRASHRVGCRRGRPEWSAA